jgi:methionyl aminopeptidase
MVKRKRKRTTDEIAAMRRAGAAPPRCCSTSAPTSRPASPPTSSTRSSTTRPIRRGAYPSPLNYRGFPKSVCTSVNEVICHGIPDSRPLADGDIVNVDVTVFLDGVHGDTRSRSSSATSTRSPAKLVRETPALYEGDRGGAARAAGSRHRSGHRASTPASPRLGVVREFIGHGIGTEFHSALADPALLRPAGDHRVIEPGMTFTIEPMLTLGADLYLWDDDWTAVTADGAAPPSSSTPSRRVHHRSPPTRNNTPDPRSNGPPELATVTPAGR